jgi:hypothetical protein
MKLDTRQKILIPLIIVAFIYVGWQIYHIFFATSPNQALLHPIALANASSGETITQPTLQIEQNQSAIPEHKTIEKLSPQEAADQSAEYQRLVNRYRELEAKRMLLEEKMAIADTEQKIAELNAKLSKFDNSQTNTSFDKERTYKLIYLDRQNGQWSATLRDDNAFLEVKPGTKLSDGSRAVAIDSKGVVLVKNGKTELLTFTGVVPLRKAQVKVAPPTQKIIEPVYSKVAVQKIEKHKISKPKLVAAKHVVKSIKNPLPHPKEISKVQLTKTSIPAEAPVKPDYTIRPVSLVANYSVKPAEKTSLQEPLKTTTNNSNITIVELAPKQTKPEPLIANYSVRPVQTVPPKGHPVKNKNMITIKHTGKRSKPKTKLKPLITNDSVKPVKSVPLQMPSENEKNNNVTVVQLAPKKVKSVRSKTQITKPIDLNYKENVNLPTQAKLSASKSISHVKITRLIPTPAKSDNKIAKVTKTIMKKPSVHKGRIRANRADQPVVFSPLPAVNNTEQDNSPIILMN